MRDQATHDLPCPADRLAISSLGKGVYEVAGCSQRSFYRCDATQLTRTRCLRVAGGAIPVVDLAQREQQVRTKAATLLACDAASLTLTSEHPRYYVAEGCGRNIQYECSSRTADCCAFENPGVQTQVTAERERARSLADNSGHGLLTKREIGHTLRGAQPELKSCFRAALGKAPFLSGVVVVKFTIAGDGHVQTAAVLRSSLDRVDVESCLLNVVRSIEFPKPEGGGTVVVAYPFVLRPIDSHATCR